MTFRIIQLPSAQPTIAFCLGKMALPSLWICFGRYRLRIGARQTVDRDAQPERRAEELHGLKIPADFVGRETPCNIRQPAKSKRYDPGMSINPLLTLKRDCRNPMLITTRRRELPQPCATYSSIANPNR
jgi:hypothetical protein